LLLPTLVSCLSLVRTQMSPQSRDQSEKKQWESVHTCPKCGFVINLEEIDLRAIATGIISCPKCDWSGLVVIEIAAGDKPKE
jgi:ribosomal protein L37AE/L43A